MKAANLIVSAVVAGIFFSLFAFFWHNHLFTDVYGFSAPGFYDLGKENAMYLNIAIAILILGMAYFLGLAMPGKGNWKRGATLGALFSGIVIATFSFINLGLSPAWTLTVAFYDIVWALISGAVAGAIIVSVNGWMA